MGNLQDFAAKIQEDADLAAKCAACKSADEFIAIAKAEGYDVTAEEIEAMTALSLDDMDSASGGMIIRKYIIVK